MLEMLHLQILVAVEVVLIIQTPALQMQQVVPVVQVMLV
jgi:hypothetical protein